MYPRKLVVGQQYKQNVYQNKTYQIHELSENDLLGHFKHLDIVECEERDNQLYAVKLVNDIKAGHPDDK
jgi:hypothetical protein